MSKVINPKTGDQRKSERRGTGHDGAFTGADRRKSDRRGASPAAGESRNADGARDDAA
jgi:hypothetical protein